MACRPDFDMDRMRNVYRLASEATQKTLKLVFTEESRMEHLNNDAGD
jgi:hypothetical protein